MSELVMQVEAFAKRVHEGRFRKGEAKEPHAIHLEEVVELVKKYGGIETEICAAWLHDTVEDCPPTSFEDIEQYFGAEVTNIVRELTDDKSLKKAERKRMQVINAAYKSPSACLIKICEETSNLRSIANSPPTNWTYERRTEYIRWAYEVVSSLPHKPSDAIKGFWMAAHQAEIRSAGDLVPFLAELGRTADRSVIADPPLPNSWDFHILWNQWDRVVDGWEAAQVANLIKGLTYFERMFDHGYGSVPPVANLFHIYAAMVEVVERDRLADWVLRNTVNDYTPYGTSNYGARSLEELAKKEDARFARRQATAARKQAMFDEARCQRSIQATERLPNALRRRDAKAVAALVARGADADAVGSSGQSAREISRDLGVAAWLSSDKKVEQQEASTLPDLSGRAREI